VPKSLGIALGDTADSFRLNVEKPSGTFYGKRNNHEAFHLIADLKWQGRKLVGHGQPKEVGKVLTIQKEAFDSITTKLEQISIGRAILTQRFVFQCRSEMAGGEAAQLCTAEGGGEGAQRSEGSV
jgi:hypothetical protein